MPRYSRPTGAKVAFSGEVVGVQPRIRLTRSYDERQHTYLGYALRINGEIGDERREFTVGIGKGAQVKHTFQAGMAISGECVPVADARTEAVEFYKAGPTRKVPGRKGMSWEEEDWIDEEATSHRDEDE